MSEISPELLCLIVIGATIIILLGAFLVLQIARNSVFGFASLIIKMLMGAPDEETSIKPQVLPKRSSEEIRAKAQALDDEFDAAVSREDQPVPTPDLEREIKTQTFPRPAAVVSPPPQPPAPVAVPDEHSKEILDLNYIPTPEETPGEKDE